MKVLILVLSIAALLASGCCAAERNLVKEIEDTHAIVIPDHLRWLEQADSGMDADQKARRKALLEALVRNTGRLKESLK